jgi:integrase-like protein
MRSHVEATLVPEALRMALGRQQPTAGRLHHLDRGSQDACPEYQRLRTDVGMRCSMSRKGDCFDHAVAERFCGSLKRERSGHCQYATRQAARDDVSDDIERCYNSTRLHSYLGDLSPNAYEAGLTAASRSVRFSLTTYVFAMARMQKFTNGRCVSDLVWHLPRHCYGRRVTSTPDGRRRDFWVFQRHATLNQLGDVTIVLSKKRRNYRPKQVRLFVTNLLEVKAGTVLSRYAWRSDVEVTIKELKRGLHLAQIQVTSDKDHIKCLVALPICAYL